MPRYSHVVPSAPARSVPATRYFIRVPPVLIKLFQPLFLLPSLLPRLSALLLRIREILLILSSVLLVPGATASTTQLLLRFGFFVRLAPLVIDRNERKEHECVGEWLEHCYFRHLLFVIDVDAVREWFGVVGDQKQFRFECKSGFSQTKTNEVDWCGM